MTSEEAGGRPGGGSRAVIFAGLALGAVAAILIAIILSSGDDDGGGDDSQTTSATTTRVAVSASEDIPARTRLTQNMLQVQTYQVEDVNPEAFTRESQVVNRVTSRDISAGEIIVPEAVSVSTGAGITFAIRDGMRGISIGVSEVILAGGNIAPGNYVDIIGVFDVDETEYATSLVEQLSGEFQNQPVVIAENSQITFTILQNIRILAVAQTLTPEVQASEASEEDDGTADFLEANQTAAGNPAASTVTLEVTPQQALAMVTADLRGTLRLSPRPFGEEEEAEVVPIILPTNAE